MTMFEQEGTRKTYNIPISTKPSGKSSHGLGAFSDPSCLPAGPNLTKLRLPSIWLTSAHPTQSSNTKGKSRRPSSTYMSEPIDVANAAAGYLSVGDSQPLLLHCFMSTNQIEEMIGLQLHVLRPVYLRKISISTPSSICQSAAILRITRLKKALSVIWNPIAFRQFSPVQKLKKVSWVRVPRITVCPNLPICQHRTSSSRVHSSLRLNQSTRCLIPLNSS